MIKRIIDKLFVLRLEYYERILTLDKCNGCQKKYNNLELNFGETLICNECGYTTYTVSRLWDSINFNLACYGRELKRQTKYDEYWHWSMIN